MLPSNANAVMYDEESQERIRQAEMDRVAAAVHRTFIGRLLGRLGRLFRRPRDETEVNIDCAVGAKRC